MPERRRRRRNSSQRNLLYDEPGPWGGLVILGIVAVVVLTLIVLGFNLIPSYSDFTAGGR